MTPACLRARFLLVEVPIPDEMPVIRPGRAPWHPALRTYYTWACPKALTMLRSPDPTAQVREAVTAHSDSCPECQEGQRDLMEK